MVVLPCERRREADGLRDTGQRGFALNSGTTTHLDWLDPGGSGLFDSTLLFEVPSAGVNEGILFPNLKVANASVSTLTIETFPYTDLADSFNNDSGVEVGNLDGTEVFATGPGPPLFIGYEAEAF